jgi:tRNA pseudouridine55 synthase
MLHGFLTIDKPAGMTSHDVVARVRRVARQKRVGHGGTLDPAATGVLPIGLGEATRLLEYLVEGRKRYLATIELGRTTTTDDAEGATLVEQPVPALTCEDLRDALATFTGTVMQVPPMYSAIQIEGRRLYDLARRGEEVELVARPVEIDQITLLDWQSPRLMVEISCGKGTYIRSLARDLGAALGCGAHLASLRRSAVGPLSLETAVPLATIEQEPEALSGYLLSPEAAVAHVRCLELDEVSTRRVEHGLPLEMEPGVAGEIARAHASGKLLALLRYDGAAWRPFKVFGWR